MKSLLRAKNVTIHIGDKTICQQATLSFQAGEIWGVLGPNGSGKTTLLHSLAGLLPVASGAMTLHGKDIIDLSIREIAKHIGLLFQDFSDTFPQTVWEYCLSARYPHLPYFKKESVHDMQIVRQALKVMDLAAFAQRNVLQLSGGEKRRVAIAAVLAQTPAVYLLDEPINHLDIRHQLMTLQHLRHLAKTNSASIVMSLHDINMAQQFCQHIVMLFADGSLVQGRVGEVMTEENLSKLYEYPITASRDSTKLFWHPVAAN